MSFLDKAKAAAAKVAEGAQKGAQQVQDKVEQSQTQKKADDLAKQLGYLIVRERTDGEPAGPRADELVSQIVAVEAQLKAAAQDGAGSANAEAASTAAPEPAPAPAVAPDPTTGDATPA